MVSQDPAGPQIVLRLLGPVTYAGRPIAGDRAQALLAAVAGQSGRIVPDHELVEAIWGKESLANPAKALQVLVSRVRAQTAPEVVERAGQGYRLGVPAEAVDAHAVEVAVSGLVGAERDGQHPAARAAADALLATLEIAPPADTGDGVLERLRERARSRLEVAQVVLGRCSSAMGRHAEALVVLERLADPDEATLAALLRSEGATRGAPAALARYEGYRRDMRDRFGIHPGPTLQAVHAELLALDNPIRTGLHFESTTLVGRERDLEALRALIGESRVTSIVGPGGIGKTRIANLLGRESELSAVHFVELAGVVSPDDVIAEVGAALAVRDSLTTQRVLTPEQRRDLRSRIAQRLDHGATLLILDNCEHVIDAVADLVARLVSAVARLRVVTTSRAPLAIAAERVYPLGQLDDAQAADLFVRRARSARPTVTLLDDTVRRVVARLDGLPLAVELAAARVRVMSVDDIASRLDDRFTLLRGGDRSAPDRHQTLLAVLDWSWNLLAHRERRALRWLADFHDGFTLTAAETVLGSEALDAVQSLVDQSLLTVVEAGGQVRYRMLETVREFGRRRLALAGEQETARQALLTWAVAFAGRGLAELSSARQVQALRCLRAEENNLSDLLRHAVSKRDRSTAVTLAATLGGFWTITDEHVRLIALAEEIDDLFVDWEPPSDQLERALAAACFLTLNTMMLDADAVPGSVRLLLRHGSRATSSLVAPLIRLLVAVHPAYRDQPREPLERLCEHPDRATAGLALMWASHERENDGDPAGAIELAGRALSWWRAEDGIWGRATLLHQLAMLNAQIGRLGPAVATAREAIPLLDQLEAIDDSMGARAILAFAAIQEERLMEADELLAEIKQLERDRATFGLTLFAVDAELALARGDIDRGIDLYRETLDRLSRVHFGPADRSTGLEPWRLFGEAAATTACAVRTKGAVGDDLHHALLAKADAALDPQLPRLDYPVAGLVAYALGAWELHRGDGSVEAALRLAVIADRFGYHRLSPSLAWRHTEQAAEARAPGMLAVITEQYAQRSRPGLLVEARAVIARIPRAAPSG
jgi:predicted ATPase